MTETLLKNSSTASLKTFAASLTWFSKEIDMMEAHLGVTTCDKCQEPMTKGQPVIIITEGSITESKKDLDYQGSCVRYACHLNCWDRVE